MVRRMVSSIAVVVATFASGVHAQDGAAALAPLQGRWVVTGGEHNGKPMDSGIHGRVQAGTMT